MLQELQRFLLDLIMGAIGWLAEAAAMRVIAEYEIEDLEARALEVSAGIYALRRNEYRWN